MLMDASLKEVQNIIISGDELVWKLDTRAQVFFSKLLEKQINWKWRCSKSFVSSNLYFLANTYICVSKF